MAETEGQDIKIAQAVALMEKLEAMQSTQFLCDFIIKAGDQEKAIAVHKPILAARSKYFEAMFESDMKESRHGSVILKEVPYDIANDCIVSMYTGNASITSTNVEGMLRVADMLHVEFIVKLCVDHLKKHLCDENCVYTVLLAAKYAQMTLLAEAEQHIINNIDKVLETEPFSSLSESDMLKYVSGAKHATKWRAATTWVREQQAKFQQSCNVQFILEGIKFQDFPFNFLLETVLTDSLVQNSESAKKIVQNFLLRDDRTIQRNLSVGNCFALHEMSETLLKPQNERKVILRFIAEHFDAIADRMEIVKFSHELLCLLLASPYLTCTDERNKWVILIKWIQCSSGRRKYLPGLMKCILFDRIPLDYIEEKIRSLDLVKDSHHCKDVVMDGLLRRARILATRLAILNHKTGVLYFFNPSDKSFGQICSGPKSDLNSVVGVNDNIYLLGGKSIWCVDTYNKKLIEKNSMNEPPSAEAQAVTFQNRLYVIEKDKIYFYDTTKNEWVYGFSGPAIDGNFCVAASDEFIYAFGATVKRFGVPRNVEKLYNPKTNVWGNIVTTKQVAQPAVAEYLRGKVYVLRDDLSPPRSVQRYDTDTNAWSSAAEMLGQRANFCSCVANDGLFVLGTNQQGFTVEAYDEMQDKWRVLASLPQLDNSGKLSCCIFRPSIIH